jgi:hypothetical protein
MMPFSQGPCLRFETSGEGFFAQHLLLPSSVQTSEVPGTLGFHLIGTASDLSFRDDYQPHACHALVQRLDERDYQRALEALSGMVAFYATRTRPAQLLPAVQRLPTQLSGSYKEPVYPVTEE